MDRLQKGMKYSIRVNQERAKNHSFKLSLKKMYSMTQYQLMMNILDELREAGVFISLEEYWEIKEEVTE